MNKKSLEDKTAFLGAISIFFATLEYLIPKPMPFIRLGLSNLPVILSFKILPAKYVFLLVILKTLGQGILNGTLLSYVFLFSLSGSFASFLVMYASFRLLSNKISYFGLSLLGSLASSLAQLFLSINFIFGTSSIIIIPPFLSMALISGALIGIFANKLDRESTFFAKLKEEL